MNEPALYFKENSLQTKDNIYVIQNYLDLVQWEEENLNVLDVGCGDGRTTAELLLPKLPSSVSMLSGCDVSENMVKFAKYSFPNPRLDFFRLDISDAAACNVLANRFDRIFSFYCLHWIPDQRKAFENFYTLLRPGGELLISFLGTNPIFDGYLNLAKNKRWAQYFRSEMISPYHNCLDVKKKVEKILSDAGFEHWKCFVEDRQFFYPNWNKVKEALKAVNPIISKLSPSNQAQYMEDFVSAVIHKTTMKWLDSNYKGPIPVNYQLIVVHASKLKQTFLA